MAFTGNVELIKRNKLYHCAVKTWCDGERTTISVCNGTWNCKDVVSQGKAEDVTCKRCKKILEMADESGYVILP